MGNPVTTAACPVQPLLPPKPGFDDNKWYHCSVDCFQDATPDNTCTQTFIIQIHQCVMGWIINGWLNSGYECLSPHELIVFTGYSAQRLVNTNGPYDTQQDCIDAN
jgi:hypothetical protein